MSQFIHLTLYVKQAFWMVVVVVVYRILFPIKAWRGLKGRKQSYRARDVGDHPPITPLRGASPGELRSSEQRFCTPPPPPPPMYSITIGLMYTFAR